MSGGPVEIGSIADDDLDLVGRLEPVEVAPDVGLDLARAGSLDVEDHPHSGIDRADVDRAAGLEQDRLAGVGKSRHERVRPPAATAARRR